jgi:hypothetical protein
MLTFPSKDACNLWWMVLGATPSCDRRASAHFLCGEPAQIETPARRSAFIPFSYNS